MLENQGLELVQLPEKGMTVKKSDTAGGGGLALSAWANRQADALHLGLASYCRAAARGVFSCGSLLLTDQKRALPVEIR